jgi:Co/Zn/Cd efflux system component
VQSIYSFVHELDFIWISTNVTDPLFSFCFAVLVVPRYYVLSGAAINVAWVEATNN